MDLRTTPTPTVGLPTLAANKSLRPHSLECHVLAWGLSRSWGLLGYASVPQAEGSKHMPFDHWRAEPSGSSRAWRPTTPRLLAAEQGCLRAAGPRSWRSCSPSCRRSEARAGSSGPTRSSGPIGTSAPVTGPEPEGPYAIGEPLVHDDCRTPTAMPRETTTPYPQRLRIVRQGRCFLRGSSKCTVSFSTRSTRSAET